MRLFGFEISRTKAQTLSAVDDGRGWFRMIGDIFGGAWQSALEVDGPKDLLAFSAVFSCVTGIAADVAKLRARIVEEDANGICTPIPSKTPLGAVLRRPNHYQTWLQFAAMWVVSKLTYGNTYVLKIRDGRRVVTDLYVLDPQRVTPLVSESGDVYYRLAADPLSRVGSAIDLPASEIIHDRMTPIWHPLVGVSPIYACGMAATMGNKIQGNSSTFFANMSAPSGMLSAPGKITDEVAARLKRTFEENFKGKNLGRLFVGGDGLEFKGFTIPAVEAQLIEQLAWTVEDVGRTFHYPQFKLGGAVPAGSTIEQLNQVYYSECLQPIIEAMESCLDEGLGISEPRYVELDLEGLMRMDQGAMAAVEEKLVKSGIKAPDEARKRFNLPPVPGGKYPYLQHQNYSLEDLSKRSASADPFATSKPAAAPAADPPDAANDDEMEDLAEKFIKGLEPDHATLSA